MAATISGKNSMIEAGLRPKTIQDAKLAPLRAILQWGVQNKLIAINAADGISLNVKSKQGEKKRSFTTSPDLFPSGDQEFQVSHQIVREGQTSSTTGTGHRSGVAADRAAPKHPWARSKGIGSIAKRSARR
jgi:hypothetical protein